jgi:hypothetical protein
MTDPRTMTVTPGILEGKLVRLDPMGMEHFDDLTAVGLDPTI